MKLRSLAPTFALLVVVGAVLGACSGEDSPELTTTSSLVTSPTASPPSSTAMTGDDTGTTSTTLVGQAVGDYDIVARESGDAGETIYVVVPPGTYTDVDLENFMLDLVESGTATYGVEVFDDAAAVDAFRKDAADRTDEEQALVDQHHFVSLLAGATIKFDGPFATSGQHPIGS